MVCIATLVVSFSAQLTVIPPKADRSEYQTQEPPLAPRVVTPGQAPIPSTYEARDIR